jgi:hypothetical protein
MAFTISAQTSDEQLAAQYFSSKEYQKAADIYEDLAKKNPESIYFYENLIQCYVQLSDFKSAEKLIDKRIKRYQFQYAYQVDKAWILHLQGQLEQRDKIFKELLEVRLNSEDEVQILANAFLKRRFLEQAIGIYLNARKYLKDETLFAYNLSELYFQNGKLKEGTSELIDIASAEPYMIEEIKNRLALAYQDNTKYSILTEILLNKLQKDPDNLACSDMLIWSFSQQRDWRGAMVQAKAIDKRLKEDGKRVMDLCSILIENELYDIAISGLEYIKSLGDNKSYYYIAQENILKCGMLRIRSAGVAPVNEVLKLEKEYTDYLKLIGENWETVPEMLDLAELYVYHLNKVDKGIEILNKAISIPGVSPKQMAACKLQLGDAMLIQGEIWEADLLYKQVEKAFTNDALGQEARFRYSRLCYFRGEFLWAQVQLDVLKGATTQLVSNNAMRLWLIIQDNIGLDTNDDALKIYAKADLLIFRNHLDEAVRLLDSIPLLFPGHTLTDEILFAKALISEKKGDFKSAEQYYLVITKDFSYDILADNALYNLARLYEFNLNDTAKAKRMYELLILNYTGSLFVSEARKRFRLLRGDAIKEQENSN